MRPRPLRCSAATTSPSTARGIGSIRASGELLRDVVTGMGAWAGPAVRARSVARFLTVGRRVALRASHLEIRVKASGHTIAEDELHLWTFDDAGRVAGYQHFVDTAKHIEAAREALVV